MDLREIIGNDYYDKKNYNFKANFTKKELELLEKFDVFLEDRLYTEYENEVMGMKLVICYLEEDSEQDEIDEKNKLLEKMGITRKESEDLLDKFDSIVEKHNK